jgi:transposase
MKTYPAAIEAQMRAFYHTLAEKDKRRYAAIEARKLGHGGITYIASLFGASRETIQKGLAELDRLPDDDSGPRQRRKGGGRKAFDETHPEIDQHFMEVLRDYTAGDPTDDQVRWTNLTQQEIRARLGEHYGTHVSRKVIRQLLKRHGFRARTAQKNKTMKQVEGRNEQFENIAQFKADFQARGAPVISIDTKKKEYLGTFYRDGTLYTREVIEVFDHDFNSFAEGRLIPHGIYDVSYNTAFISIGTSHDTSEFACESLRRWWSEQGRYDWPGATDLLVLCDGGGSNSSRHYIFKQDLQDLADEWGLEIRIAHYPPYCSKYNPIEHRVFPHLTRVCQGVVFKSIDLVKELMEKAKTKTGLAVQVRILDKLFETGRKVASDFKETMRIVFDEYLPDWNYVAMPAHSLYDQVI